MARAAMVGLQLLVLAVAVHATAWPPDCSRAGTDDEATCRLWQQWLEAGKQLRERGFSLEDQTEMLLTGRSDVPERQLLSVNSDGGSSNETNSSNGGEHDDTHGDGHHGPHAHDAFLWMFVVLAMGASINWILSRVAPGIPYTVTVYLVGMIMGVLDAEVRKSKGEPSVFSQSLVMWSGIDPHMMLHAFLPALLFGDSFGINKHQFYKALSSATLLATVGVLYSALVTGVVLHYLSPMSLTFYEACTAGSILSATDPVAVVGILKALGASAKLNMLISGESLMNDGVALVIYSIFHNMSLGQEYTAGEMIVFFLRLFFGGIALGVLFGVLTYFALMCANSRLHHDDTLIQTSIMFSAAYLAFWVGESEAIHVSGVLATVVCSLICGFHAPQLLVDRDKVMHVWHFAEYVGNTLLFMLAGVIIGDAMVSDTLGMSAGEICWVLALYVFGILIRGAVVFTFFPVLRKLGYGLMWQEAVVMVWGGLRGAVGLAMAVEVASTAVDKDGNTLDASAIARRKYILFQVGMFTTMTLIVNAPTTGILLRKLGLIRTTAMQALIQKGHEERLCDAARVFYVGSKNHRLFKGHSKTILEDVIHATHGHDHENSFAKRLESFEDSLSAFRESFLRILAAEYWIMVDHGLLPLETEVLQNLLASVDHAKDHVSVNASGGLKDWEYMEAHFRRDGFASKTLRCKNPVGRCLSTYLDDIVATECLCFIGAHEESQKRAAKHMSGGFLEHVTKESKENMRKAEEFLATLNSSEVAQVKTWQLSRAVLDFQRQKVQKWHAHGIITGGEAHDMLHNIGHGSSHLASVALHHSASAIFPVSESDPDPDHAVSKDSKNRQLAEEADASKLEVQNVSEQSKKQVKP